MGLKIAGESGQEVEVDALGSSQRVSLWTPGRAYSAQALTNTIGAGMGTAGSMVWGMRYSPTAGARVAVIHRIYCRWVTIAAFTTPVTQNRSLTLFRFSAASPTGGGAMAPLPRKTSWSASYFTSGLGGDARCATTTSLTTTGITIEPTALKRQGLVHVGAAGATTDWNWGEPGTEFVYALTAGEGLCIKPDVTMDAGGTWQLFVNCEWTEHDSDPFA